MTLNLCVCLCVNSCVLVLSVLMEVKKICLIREVKFTKIVKYNVHLNSVTIMYGIRASTAGKIVYIMNNSYANLLLRD